ncbi:MAG: UvrD-helicase domain-containing protein [Propionibacteriaceae bacterium]|jgi:exodeoxyribonuclease V beta subunit|nr:UvrD-helicase domain-containing protein [Propionibacteriaceae bacterium]
MSAPITVIEASAGTGKTFTIATEAVRYLAEGRVTPRELAIITFSRNASLEIKDRVRSRISSAITLLQGRKAAQQDDPDGWLLDDPELMPAYLERLQAAEQQLDSSALMTIHEFCSAMYAQLGVLANGDVGRLLEDPAEVLKQAVEDAYLKTFAAAPPGFGLEDAQKIALGLECFPDAKVTAADDDASQARAQFAAAFQAEYAAAKARLGVYTFNDQLVRLRDALAVSPAAVERLRGTLKVVLVDEFQDTDTIQWELLERCFAGHAELVLVGDPKQSIYRFRGADITAYRRAVGTATEKQTLGRNHRADAQVIETVNRLFANAELGEGIGVPMTTATHRESRLLNSPFPPVWLRELNYSNPPGVDALREQIFADLVAAVAQLFSSTAAVVDEEGTHPICPKDVAILVTKNEHGEQLVKQLSLAGIPAAFSGADSVFATAAAQEWEKLLRAFELPRRGNVRHACLTPFIGANLADLAAASSSQLSSWLDQLSRWADVYRREGVAALFAAISADGSFASRLLGKVLGERQLTDHIHLSQVLSRQYHQGVQGPALLEWLTDKIASDNTREHLRRLESDADAVQILTIHKAKGLEWPVVFLPTMWDRFSSSKVEYRPYDFKGPVDYHDETGQRCLDVSVSGSEHRKESRRRWAAEDAADELRRLYVACTRARSQLTLWWAASSANTTPSPLHRLLARDPSVVGVPQMPKQLVPPGEMEWPKAAGLQFDRVPEAISGAAAPARLPARAPSAALTLAEFTRSIDQDWRRTSYSGLTAGVHDGPVRGGLDEPEDAQAAGADEAAPAAGAGQLSPLAGFPGGTTFGSLVHEVYEQVDWHTGETELLARLEAVAAVALRRYPLPDVGAAELAAGLAPALLTPLGKLAGGKPLTAFPRSAGLAELTFEFPLDGSAKLSQVAELLAAKLPAGDPLADYPAALADPALAQTKLRGFLTGSIDLLLREAGKYYIFDYKTNSLGDPATVKCADFDVPAMAAEMIRSHYPLQAILYAVALHRFLRHRLPGYRPDEHLGGVGYLFVRGMSPAHPEFGVFQWFPPAELVVELSDLIGGGHG